MVASGSTSGEHISLVEVVGDGQVTQPVFIARVSPNEWAEGEIGRENELPKIYVSTESGVGNRDVLFVDADGFVLEGVGDIEKAGIQAIAASRIPFPVVDLVPEETAGGQPVEVLNEFPSRVQIENAPVDDVDGGDGIFGPVRRGFVEPVVVLHEAVTSIGDSLPIA